MGDLTRRIVLELLAKNRAAGEMASFSRSIDTVYRGARRMAVGLLAAAGVGGIGYMIKQEMEAVHTTTNLAARLGMSTEALVGLQHAAKLTDVEQEQLTRSMDFFNRTLGEAQMGSASAAKAFKAIGISFRDMAGLNPDQKIGLVADQINKLGTQSQKAAAVQDIFGRGSQNLLGLLGEGSKGLAAYRLETEKLGLSFSQVDAAKVEMAIESITRMRAVFTGLFRQTAIQVAPYIEVAASAFVNWATAGEGVGARITTVFETVTLSIVKTGEEIERLIMKFDQLGSPIDYMRKVSAANEKAIAQYRSITGDTKAFTSPLGPLGATVPPRDPYMFEVTQNVQRQAAGLEIKSRESEIRSAFEKLRMDAEKKVREQRAKALIQEYRAARNPVKVITLSTEEMKGVVEQTRDAMESVRHQDYLTRIERIESLRIYKRENAATLAQVEEANRLLDQEIRSLERSRLDAMKVYNAEMRERLQEPYLVSMDYAADFTRYSEGEWKSFWDPVIDGSKDASQAVDDFFRNLAIKFAQLQAQKAMMSFWDAALGPALTAGITGAFGGLFAGAGRGPSGSVNPNYSPNFSTTYSNSGVAPVIGHRGGRVGDLTERRWVDSSIFENAPRFHDLRPGETAVIAQDDEVISRPGRGGGESAALLRQIVTLLSQRQTINARIVDHRDVVTKERMEGKEGERYVMYHSGRNS